MDSHLAGQSTGSAVENLDRGAPLDSEVAELRAELRPLVPTVAAVFGIGSSQFKLLERAILAPDQDPVEKARRLRLAKYALDEASSMLRHRLFTWR